MAEKKKKNSKTIKKLVSSIVIIAVVVGIVLAIINFNSIVSMLSGSKTNDNGSKSEGVALVNGEEITAQELDNQYNLFFQITGYPEQYKQIITKDKLLDQLIIEDLLMQKAESEGFDTSVDDEQINNLYTQYMLTNPLGEEQFSAQLAEDGLTLDDVKEYFNKQIILTDYLNATILSGIEVSDDEVQKYYDNNPDQFSAQDGQIRASHILVETEDKANNILYKIKQGADFGELAKENSIDTASGAQSGDLGFFSKGDMVKEFEDAAFALDVGEVSFIVQTQYGYHLIKREADTISFDDSKDLIKRSLQSAKQNSVIQTEIQKLKSNADIVINLGSETESDVTDNTALQEDSATDSCLDKYSISSNTVIFLYSDSCSYCNKMKPIVTGLEEKGYGFYWVQPGTQELKVVQECLSDVIDGRIPQFICAGSKLSVLGAMPEEDLVKFADACN